MREPRPAQRFPDGGKPLYELMRMDHEPGMIVVFPRGLVSRERASLPDTLVYEPEFDPMIYFWPVEKQHVLVCLDLHTAPLKVQPAEEALARMAKALLRDGAKWVTISWWKAKLGAGEDSRLQARNWGDPEGFMRERYADDPGLSGRGPLQAGVLGEADLDPIGPPGSG